MAIISNINDKLTVSDQGQVSFNRVDDSEITGYSFPTTDGSANQILKTNGLGILTFVADETGTLYTAGDGINFSGASSTVINADINYISYSGSNNFIVFGSQNNIGTTIPTGSLIAYANPGGTQIIGRGTVGDLPFSNNSGNVTGSGTLNKVARWTATGDDLGDGPITFSSAGAAADSTFGGGGTFGAVVRINGTTTTGLVIASSSVASNGLKLYNNSTTDNAYIYNHFSGNLEIGTSNATVLTMNGTTSTFVGSVGIGTNSPNAKLEVASGQAKTVTSGVEFARFGTSNEASNYATLTCEVKGGANAAARKWIFQTIEAGVANAGNIAFQPSGGNVGIGTDSPSTKLTISGVQELLQLTRGGASDTKWFFSADSTRLFIAENTSATANIKLTINKNGNVGIGTSTPSTTEPIGGNLPTGWTRAGSTALEIAASDFANSGLFLRNSDTTATGTDITADQYFGDTYIDNRFNNDNGSIYFRTKTAVAPSIGMAIKGTGKVGIGTTSPIEKLQVTGQIISTGSNSTLNTSGAQRAIMDLSGFSATDTSARFGHFRGATAAGAGQMRLYTDSVERVRINASGNVGIGTTNPIGNGLTVAASTNGKGVEIQTSASTQYVLAYDRGAGAYDPLTVAGSELRFQTGNIYERMRIWSAGMVQIGGDVTATPELLTVQAYTRNEAFSGKYSASGYLWFLRNETGPSGRFQLYNAGSTTINLEGNTTRDNYILGDLGIGTTFPDTTFHVKGISSLEETTAGAGTQLRLIGQDSSGQFNFLIGKQFNVNNTFEITPSTAANGTTFSNPAFVINSTGDVGINDISPSYKLDVDGTIRATGDVIAYSDERIKENIKTISNSLEKVSKLRGVEFNKIGEDIKSIGVIAQEIEKVIPEVVREDDKGMKSVAYGNITGILIEAIKELKQEIEELKNKSCNCNCK